MGKVFVDLSLEFLDKNSRRANYCRRFKSYITRKTKKRS